MSADTDGGGITPKKVAVVSLFAFILGAAGFFNTFDISSGKNNACFPHDIGSSKCPIAPGVIVNTSLGVWTNFPTASSCGDLCEMMNGNQSYRGVISFPAATGEGGYSVGLEVNCISPTFNRWSYLQLQYATFVTTQQVNSTNFVNIGGPVYVDGFGPANNWSCPNAYSQSAMLVGTSALITSSSSPINFIFRVVGLNDTVAGDTLRLASASVYLIQNILPIISVQSVKQKTIGPNSGFVWQGVTNIAPSASTTVTIHYIATNETGTVGCGANDLCVQAGDGTCTILANSFSCSQTTTNYATSFTGTTKTVVSVQNGVFASIGVAVGTLNLFSAQTLTV